MAEHAQPASPQSATKQPTDATGEAARAPSAGGASTQLARSLLARGTSAPGPYAELLRARPEERDSVIALLHQTTGNGFVQQVLREARIASPVLAKGGAGELGAVEEDEALTRVSASRGSPLASDVAERMAQLLNHDLGHVIIHTDDIAATAAKKLGARAFTIGEHIYFASGAFAPGTPEGDRLLVHELTHVAQHDRGALAPVGESESRVAKPSSAPEQEASSMEGLAQTGQARTRGRGGNSDRAPVMREVHGVPNEGMDCFMSSVLQMLATSYAPLFEATNRVAPAAVPLQTLIREAIAGLRGRARAYKPGDTKQLRAQLKAMGIIESSGAQEDAAQMLRLVIDPMLTLEGRTLVIGGGPQVAPKKTVLTDQLLAANPDLEVLRRFTFDRTRELSYEEKDAKAATKPLGSDVPEFDANRKSAGVEANLAMVTVEMDQYASLEQFLCQRYGTGYQHDLRGGNEMNGRTSSGAAVQLGSVKEQLGFARLPQVMTFVVQRFFGDQKLDHDFPMPTEMTLKRTVGTPYCTYRLKSMVVHQSAVAERGHYVAEVNEGGAWQTANDGSVTANQGNAPAQTSSGYLYAYELVAQSDVAPKDGAIQDAQPAAAVRRMQRPAQPQQPHAAGKATSEKQGLPNAGRGEHGKSDCFINAVVQLIAGPYHDLFDPAKNKLERAGDIEVQAQVWALLRKVHKLDENAPLPKEVADLRATLVKRGVIAHMNTYEDASEVLVKLLEVVSKDKLETKKTRTIEKSEPSQKRGGDPAAYENGKRTIPSEGPQNGYLPVDIGEYASFHQYLYQAFGAGGQRTAHTEDNRAEVTNNGQRESVSSTVEHTSFTRLPGAMTFQLKRLPVGEGKPNLRSFYMPPSMTLVQQPERGEKAYVSYQLKGAVTWEASHYTARVAHGDKWLDFNDEQVREAQGNEDVLTHGYLYTYVETARTPAAKEGVMQEIAPITKQAPLGKELLIDYENNAIMHVPTKRPLRTVLQTIGAMYPVMADGAKSLAVAKALSLLDGIGMFSTGALTPENRRAQDILAGCDEAVKALGTPTLADAYAAKLPAPPPTTFEERGSQALAPFMYEVDGGKQDLSKLSVVQIRAKLGAKVASDKELAAYVQFRARKEFYESVHLVYDLDQTLITSNAGEYKAPAPGDLAGTLQLDFEKKTGRKHQLPIDLVVPKDTNTGDYQASYRRRGDDRAWSQHYAPKTNRQRGENGESTNERGDKEEGSREAFSPGMPSNQAGKASAVKAISIRPGAIESLQELDNYGVHQSLWTHNSQHHMNRVLELFEQRGFAEHRFDTKKAEKLAGHGGKPLEHIPTEKSQTAVLIDDYANRGNHELGNVKDDKLAPMGADRRGELMIPTFGDPKDFAPGADDELGKLLGDRLMVKLALAQVGRKDLPDEPLAREFLDAMKAIVSPEKAVADDALLAALDVYLAKPKAKEQLREGFQRFQPPQQHPNEDPSLFALTPSLGASALTASSKEADKTNYTAATLVNRGLIETELVGDKRFVRVYQSEANALTHAQTAKTNFKEIHQIDGQIDLVKGNGQVCFGVGTPLRALRWFEKYQEEHYGKGFNPVVRSFLIPLEVYADIASRASPQSLSSNPRYAGVERSTNVDIGHETDQYETREGDLALFQKHAVSGSLVSWALDNSRLEKPISGDVRPIHALYDRIGMTPLAGILTARKGTDTDTYDPTTKNGAFRNSGFGAKADELAEIGASYRETHDREKPDAYLETRYGGVPTHTPEARVEAMHDFQRMHLFNPPEGKRLQLANDLDNLCKLVAEHDARAAQKAEHEKLKKADDKAAEPPLDVKAVSIPAAIKRICAATAPPLLALRQRFVEAYEEYCEYLKTQKQVVPAAWASNLEQFAMAVIVPLPHEAVRYKIRMERIHEERMHHEAKLREAGKPVPVWTDGEFFMRELVPSAATSFAIAQSIEDNTHEALTELSQRHPEHARSEAALQEEQAKGNPKQLPDTPMKQIDFGERKRENERIRERGSALGKLINDRSSTPAGILDAFVKAFPELKTKFDDDQSNNEYASYRVHAERVIGQFLKYFRDGKHPLLPPDAMVKMILFHDMDKWRGRNLAKKGGSNEQEAMAKASEHTGLSAAAIRARFDSRLAEEGPDGDKDSAAEHVLPALMMQRYGALWDSPDQARTAIAIVDGDPIGALAKFARKQPPPSESALLAKRQHSFQEVVKMAGKAGIPSSDHAGVAAFYYQLLQFFQADSSSYSTDATHTGEDQDKRRNTQNKTFDTIYEREGLRSKTNADDGEGTYKGFLTHQPDIAKEVSALTAMFGAVGKHVPTETKKPVRTAKKKPKTQAPDNDVAWNLDDFFSGSAAAAVDEEPAFDLHEFFVEPKTDDNATD